MIPNGEGWHYLAVKTLSAFLREIRSKHHRDFYCLKCLHSFRTEYRLKSHKKVCENKYFFNVAMPSEDTKILEFNQYQKSDKAPFVIYADLESLREKIDGCKNNSENPSTTKFNEHIPSGFSTSTISSFKSIENNHDVCRCKNYMKIFCEFLREHAMKIINIKRKKKLKLLQKSSRNHMKMQKYVIFIKKNLKIICER